MIATWTMRRLVLEPRAATALEYGLAGGVLALVGGLLFLHIGPHLADAVASMALRLRGIKSAG